MEFRDYYKILGVKRDAAEEDIKRAYRRLARKFHPDVNPGDSASADRFKEINEAYQVLGDPEKRGKYDHFGSDWRKYGSVEEAFKRGGVHVATGGGAAGGFDFGGLGGFSEFFKTLFGEMAGQAAAQQAAPRGQRVADIEHDLDVALNEVMAGGTRVLNLRIPESDGRSRNRRIEVKIPRGVRDGSRIRVAGEGAYRNDGLRGDLFLKVHVVPEKGFEKRGSDLVVDIEIPLSEALLGATASLANLDGSRLAVKIPPETANGSMLRLRGQGLPSLNGTTRGDLLVRMRVQLPRNLTAKEKRLLYEFGTGRNEKPNRPD